jgi:hypothetical protein
MLRHTYIRCLVLIILHINSRFFCLVSILITQEWAKTKCGTSDRLK